MTTRKPLDLSSASFSVFFIAAIAGGIGAAVGNTQLTYYSGSFACVALVASLIVRLIEGPVDKR